MARCRDELGWVAQVADLGGGFGIRHHPDDEVPDAADLARSAADAPRASAFVEAGLPQPEIWLEPGRCLVGRAGVTLYRVGSVKRLPGRTWVAIDGGMSDNPRPQLYDARYTALSATRADEPADELVSVAGMHCESGDVLIDDVALPALAAETCWRCRRPARTRSRWRRTTTASRDRPPFSSATVGRASSAAARRSTTCCGTRLR